MKNINVILIFWSSLIFSLLLIYFVVFLFLYKKLKRNEFFSDFHHDVEMFVITMKDKDRLENIETQQNKIGKSNQIQTFDAIVGKNVNAEELITTGVLNEKYKHPSHLNYGEIGCYLSHLNLLKSVKKREGYTIIFEDDFDIKDTEFIKHINSIIKSIKNQFDIIFLGNLNDNHGEHIVDDIYKIDKGNWMWGTHAYLVNNENIDHIVDNMKRMTSAIDDMYETNAKMEILNICLIYPIMVDQIRGDIIPSTIR